MQDAQKVAEVEVEAEEAPALFQLGPLDADARLIKEDPPMTLTGVCVYVCVRVWFCVCLCRSGGIGCGKED